MFTTGRLRLRACEGPKDVDKLVALQNNVVVAPLFTDQPIIPLGPKAKDGISSWTQRSLMFCVIEKKDTGDFMGFVAFTGSQDSRNRKTTLAMGLLPQFWGEGYGKEALKFMLNHGFRSLGLHRVSLNVFEWNLPALALYRNVGFVEEGRQREAIWHDGCWKDVIFMGLLEKEWAEQS